MLSSSTGSTSVIPQRRQLSPESPGVACFKAGDGRTIYTFTAAAFPGLAANIYVIDDGDSPILVDCGSGMEQSNRDLLAGFAALRDEYGVSLSLSTIGRVLISHGHIDHFGGLRFVREHSSAPIGVHLLDRRILSHYEERVVLASHRLQQFLAEAGIDPDKQERLMAMYLFAKGVYRSTPVDYVLEEDAPPAGIDAVYHVPGHCPGQVCLQVGDILLTADHVLSHTTPHQAPESITLNTGLGHYLDSLAKVARLDGIRLALGAHEAPMADLHGRIQTIIQLHQERLEKILDLCDEPSSVAAISKALFGRVDSYHVLLALEETGAHVEYLHQRGELLAANVSEIEANTTPVILYTRA